MKEQILEWCKTLAKSQGFYGRLFEQFEDSTNLDNLANICEKENIKDIVDFVMYFES